jgi:WsaF, N-terminal domain/WsaF, C-terminal domain
MILLVQPAKETAVSDEFGIRDLIPIHIVPAAEVVGVHRLNLLIPTLDFAHSFGGVTTALRLMRRLAPEFDAVRIIVTYQTHAEIDFSVWPGWVADEGVLKPRSIIGIGDRSTPVSVVAGDVFLATAWQTALYARKVLKRQAESFPTANRRFVYFIQDYEPGFYAWSVQYWYAESTYHDTSDTIAVFNSGRMAAHFANKGVRFSREYVLEPLMHPELRETQRKTRGQPKERLIYVYARATLPRNGFDLIIESLRLWAREFPSAHEWSVVSFGDQHKDIPLGESVVLQSMGKGSMHRYGEYLSRCWVGLSFQFMAHPSYSRLEMSQFGAWVITNKIKDNDLSDLAPNILCVEKPTPEAVSQKLGWCCSQYGPGLSAVMANLPLVFEDRDDEFPDSTALVRAWCGTPVSVGGQP